MRTFRLFSLLFFGLLLNLHSQITQKTIDNVYVDSNGVMRWQNTNEEVALFGVNYTTPFAYAYRAHQRLGLSHKKAIDIDVAQMKRLGFDAFRVHVWEKEISDSVGNLLKNEHLDLFDYLLAKLSDNGIKTIITPIAWWGAWWPEPDEPSKGYTQGYRKVELITKPEVRAAQRRYLQQFITHVNPYKKISYKDDPYIVAAEIVNEPNHPDSAQQVTDYINEMVNVLRSSGFKKPIFYNISETWSNVQANAVANADIQGVTFQWYPTSLVHNKMLTGNYLVNVNRYRIPSDRVMNYGSKTKMVYEFDAADVGGSYMYPAMVRSFREQGMQFAAMFAYDPTQIAWSNTEYGTHFLNLLYTPQKAISILIAAEAFRRLPRNTSYGTYPSNNQFGDCRVSYTENLSELNSSDKFYYSNSTQTIPKDIAALQHIVGYGTSLVVHYDGTGAYFLDKLENGIWRLEVYPDALWILDPFERTSVLRQAARLFWNERKIIISLPDLGSNYVIHSLSGTKKISNNIIIPGAYIVSSNNVSPKQINKYLAKKEKFLDGLYRPAAVEPKVYVVNKTSLYALELNPDVFKFQIASEGKVSKAHLYIRRLGWNGFAKHELKNTGGFEYTLVDTPRMLQSGKVEYCVEVESEGKTISFPEGINHSPSRWDFNMKSFWSINIVKEGEPFVLLDVNRDRRDFITPHFNRTMRYTVDYKLGENSNELAVSINIIFSNEAAIPFGLQLATYELTKPIASTLSKYRSLILKGRALKDSSAVISIHLRTLEGKNYSANVPLTNNWNDVTVPLSEFKSAKGLILPNSYPLFLEKEWDSPANEPLNLEQLEQIQVVVDPSNVKTNGERKEVGFEIVSVTLK